MPTLTPAAAAPSKTATPAPTAKPATQEKTAAAVAQAAKPRKSPPKAAKTAKAAKAAPPALRKLLAPAKPAPAPAKAAKPAGAIQTPPVPVKIAKAKLVRDSFTMPQADFALIAALKQRALKFHRPAKKSELLRAGLHALQALGDTQLHAALDALEPLKPGRPKAQASAD